MSVVLGIETSCDETAVAIVDSLGNIISNHLYSQILEHKSFGGVVPEIAARSHVSILPKLFKNCLSESGLTIDQIDAIAVTSGPGLIGGLMVGVVFAKAVASISSKPIIAVNHLEGHVLTARLSSSIEFPYLVLLISGGHCQIILVLGVGKYKVLSSTIDDASGEVFDKVAKMLDLGYPGGPHVEKQAIDGNPLAFRFPKPLCTSESKNLSFSGLKTAIRNCIESQANIEKSKSDICASFQQTVSDIFIYKLNQIIATLDFNISKVVIAGGVAANKFIRNRLSQYLEYKNIEFIAPPINLCTDNAAMIAWAGIERLNLGLIDDLKFEPKSRWSLEQ